mmetsp:Transcript_10246/g.13443  ORF Transcript_10246/g.13443 Transcript_10246/m.13443 type:complete len:937 (+) Transcript_10246:534-3344(+)
MYISLGGLSVFPNSTGRRNMSLALGRALVGQRNLFVKGVKDIRGRCLSTEISRSKGSQDIPSEADVVVIGGGSIGASTLYHLQKRGLNAILLEKDKLTSGTTWHSAGMLWRLRPSDSDIEMHTYTREMCKLLEEETGETSWHENGGLFIAGNKERLTEYERLHEMGKYYDIESHVLTPEEVKTVHPLLRVDDIYGGMYSPTDGTIDPTGIVMAYSKAAKKMGAKIFENVSVSSIEVDELTNQAGLRTKRVRSVNTSSGKQIKCQYVVNATGAWGNYITDMVGERIPLRAIKHAFVVTEKLEGMHSMLPNVRDHDLSIYLKTQGNAMAIGGYESNPEFWNDVASEFSFGLFDLDWDTFAQNFNGHIQRCPSLESTGIASTVCGPESFTPDHKPLVGPQPGVRGFFQACGFNSMGMMLGGGIGRELATWIVEGSPSIDLFSFDVSRFHPDTIIDDDNVRDRTHESYAKTYAIVFPQDEPLAGRNVRQSGLHPLEGCMYQSRHGFERPGWFITGEDSTSKVQLPDYDYYGAYADGGWRIEDGHSDVPKNSENQYLHTLEKELTFDMVDSFDTVAEECFAARNGVVFFDQSYFGKFFLTGEDAGRAAQFICSADLHDKNLGSVTYTTLCNQRGGVEADLTIARLPDGSGYYFAAGGQTLTKDFHWIKSALEDNSARFPDVYLRDASNEMDMISIQGPHSRDLLQSLVTSGHSLSEENFAFSTCQNLSVCDIPVLCMRLTFVGELGFELHVQKTDSRRIYDALKEAGKKYAEDKNVPVKDAGYKAIDSMSAEMGYRHWHADVTNRDTPMEAAIGFTALKKLKQENLDGSFDFIGRESLNRHRAAGLQRKLVCLTVDAKDKQGDPVLFHGFETIWRNGECMGLVRSTAFGHTIKKTIAYGYVDLEKTSEKVQKITNKWLESGFWEIGDRGNRYEAKFHKSPP